VRRGTAKEANIAAATPTFVFTSATLSCMPVLALAVWAVGWGRASTWGVGRWVDELISAELRASRVVDGEQGRAPASRRRHRGRAPPSESSCP
jgi:hypothetical protein